MFKHAFVEIDFLVWRAKGKLRRWWRQVVLPLFCLLLSVPLGSQEQGAFYGVLLYDLDSTSLIYCKGGEGFLQANTGNIITSGSSTTVTNAGTSDTPFSVVAAGDVIIANGLFRRVTAKASDVSITVDSAINLDRTGGYPWFFIHFVCGTGADDGWMPIHPYGTEAIIVFELNQANTTTGIDVRWECRAAVAQAQPIQVNPISGFTLYVNGDAGKPDIGRTAVAVPGDPWRECRVGMKLNTTDDGDDATTNAEQINVYLAGRK